jgi:hypothetical protein
MKKIFKLLMLLFAISTTKAQTFTATGAGLRPVSSMLLLP